MTKLYGPKSLIPVPLPVQACDPMSPANDSSLAKYVGKNLLVGVEGMVDGGVSLESFVYDDGDACYPLTDDDDRVPEHLTAVLVAATIVTQCRTPQSAAHCHAQH